MVSKPCSVYIKENVNRKRKPTGNILLLMVDINSIGDNKKKINLSTHKHWICSSDKVVLRFHPQR